MAAQKIVIRFNKASSGSPPEMPAKIEEEKSWHIPRVLAFFVVCGGLLFLLVKGISNRNAGSEGDSIPGGEAGNAFVASTLLGEKSVTNHVATNSVGNQVGSRAVVPIDGKNASEAYGALLSNAVTRAQLTHAVLNNEPIDRVSSPVHVSSAKAVTLSFFTLLEGMTGKEVQHRWQHDGKVVGEMKFAVEGDPWPVYSSKYLNNTMLGQWKVVVLDNTGVQLKSEDFLVVDK